MPLDALAAEGIGVEALDAPAASPELRRVLDALIARTRALLDTSRPFASRLSDRRLAFDVAAIQRLAEGLCDRLAQNDPLSARVHHTKLEMAALTVEGRAGRGVRPRSRRRRRGAGVSMTAEAPEQQEKVASGSSFYAGMRILPKAERAGMYAVYGFCRVVDDIADDQIGDRAARRAELDGWRADLASLYAGGPAGRADLVADAVHRFGLRQADFLAVLDGMRTDVDADVRAPAFADFDLYCDRVASAVGRLSDTRVRHAGRGGRRAGPQPGPRAAVHKRPARPGRGRRHRPPVHAARVPGRGGRSPPTTPAPPSTTRASTRPPVAWPPPPANTTANADLVLGLRPPGRLAAPRLMSAVYGRILAKMEAVGWTAPRERARLSRGALLWIVLRRGLLG